MDFMKERITEDAGEKFAPSRYGLKSKNDVILKPYGTYDLFFEITFQVLQKLGAYEDIGTPEECKEAVGYRAEYEALEEQGKLLILPVPVGSLVYEPYRFLGEGAWEIDVHKIRLEDLDKIGKTVFLTREEAEVALKELEGKEE